MQKWIEAVWTPVPGGFASEANFKNNMQRFKDANQLAARGTKKRARLGWPFFAWKKIS
jgi:hypothetical protein